MKIQGSSYYGSSSQPQEELRLGVYRHFKGDEYEVTDILTNRDTNQVIVAYKGLNNDGMHEWRTIEEFMETISSIDYSGPRFIFIRETN